VTVDLSKLPPGAHGFTIDYRRYGTDWPLPFRARVVYTKNERDDSRLFAYGATAQEAVDALVAELDRIRDEQREATSELTMCGCCGEVVPPAQAYYDALANAWVCDNCVERYGDE